MEPDVVFSRISEPTCYDTDPKKWASADSEIDEAVKVCRRIEDALNSEQFCQLKTVAILDVNPLRRHGLVNCGGSYVNRSQSRIF